MEFEFKLFKNYEGESGGKVELCLRGVGVRGDKETQRERERETDRQTDRQTEEAYKGRQSKKKISREREAHVDIQRQRGKSQ